MSIKPVKVIKLKHPFTVGEMEESVTEVIFKRRIKGKDMKRIGENPTFDDFLEILSRVTGMEPYYFDEMDALDLMDCVGVVTDFLGVTPPTGLTNSAQ